MTTAIVRQELTPTIWKTIESIAPTMMKSRLFGMQTTEQAMAIMLKGYELGLSLTAAFEFINVIQDKPSLIPRGALALILGSPEYAGLKIEDKTDDKGNPTACVVWMKRRNGLEYTAKFTMEDAKRAELIKAGSGWAKYPANMLRWRALGYCADVVFPDVLGGMKRSDELGADLTPEGEVIQGSFTVVEKPQPQKPVDTNALLTALLGKYGPTAVMEANNGQIPQTVEQINAIDAKLGAELKAAAEAITDDVVEMNPN